MPDQELIDYINKAKEQNMSEEDIRNSLKDGGWSDEDINNAFGDVKNEKQGEEQSVELEPKKKARRKKWLKKVVLTILGISVALYVLTLILPHVLGYFFPDIEEVDDIALKLEVVEIADEDNAYFDLMKAVEVLDLDDIGNKIIKGEITDSVLIEDLLTRNKETLYHFQQASTKSYVNPKMIDPDVPYMDVEIPPLNKFRDIAQINILASTHYASQGLFEDSYNASITTLNVGDVIQHASFQTFIENLVAKAMISLGLEGLQESTISCPSKIHNLQEKISSLDKFYDSEEGTVLALKMEYLVSSEAIDSLADGTLVLDRSGSNTAKMNKYYFQPNRTKQLFADFFQYAIEMKEDPSKPQLDTWVDFIYEVEKKKDSSYITKLFSKNLAGKIVTSVVIVSHNNNTKDDRIDVYVGATQLTLALRGYHQEHGELPLSLNALVPEYLTEIPSDPFSGGSIKYDPERKVVYSIGWNKIDDGGLLEDEEYKDDVFSVDFEQVKNDLLDTISDTQDSEDAL
ncbi:MAG: hypothetical protein KAS07_01620 [Candidatus Pacebacteria bacterium]|nr:hypothetical protein [Candidatus Paceibacterota bacterium]